MPRRLLRDRAIEHPADNRTVETRRGDAKTDDAGEDVHHDHDPVALEQNRFAPKEGDAPQVALRVPDDGEPSPPWYLVPPQMIVAGASRPSADKRPKDHRFGQIEPACRLLRFVIPFSNKI